MKVRTTVYYVVLRLHVALADPLAPPLRPRTYDICYAQNATFPPFFSLATLAFHFLTSIYQKQTYCQYNIRKLNLYFNRQHFQSPLSKVISWTRNEYSLIYRQLIRFDRSVDINVMSDNSAPKKIGPSFRPKTTRHHIPWSIQHRPLKRICIKINQ